MAKIKMGKSILLKISRYLNKMIFFSYIFWLAIPHLIICFSQ